MSHDGKQEEAPAQVDEAAALEWIFMNRLAERDSGLDDEIAFPETELKGDWEQRRRELTQLIGQLQELSEFEAGRLTRENSKSEREWSEGKYSESFYTIVCAAGTARRLIGDGNMVKKRLAEATVAIGELAGQGDGPDQFVSDLKTAEAALALEGIEATSHLLDTLQAKIELAPMAQAELPPAEPNVLSAENAGQQLVEFQAQLESLLDTVDEADKIDTDTYRDCVQVALDQIESLIGEPNLAEATAQLAQCPAQLAELQSHLESASALAKERLAAMAKFAEFTNDPCWEKAYGEKLDELLDDIERHIDNMKFKEARYKLVMCPAEVARLEELLEEENRVFDEEQRVTSEAFREEVAVFRRRADALQMDLADLPKIERLVAEDDFRMVEIQLSFVRDDWNKQIGSVADAVTEATDPPTGPNLGDWLLEVMRRHGNEPELLAALFSKIPGAEDFGACIHLAATTDAHERSGKDWKQYLTAASSTLDAPLDAAAKEAIVCCMFDLENRAFEDLGAS